MSIVVLNSRTFTLGSVLTLNEHAAKTCNGAPHGLKVLIARIKKEVPDIYVGLSCPDMYQEGWGDLDGEVEEGKGWWISVSNLEKSILEGGERYKVDGKVEFKGQDLNGRSCNILASFDNGMVFVEFEEDVSGCSADGLGKSGHCVAVNTNFLKRIPRAKSAK